MGTSPLDAPDADGRVEDENLPPNDGMGTSENLPVGKDGDIASSTASHAAPDAAEAAARAREARFLASQSARTAERRSRAAAAAAAGGGGSDDGTQRSEFWAQFRSRCSNLSGRVESLLREEGGYVTASRRAEGRSELESVLASARELERHCLGTTASSALLSSSLESSSCRAADDGDRLPPVPDHLPPGDVRLIGEEIAKLTDKVDGARDVICPPELFVFRRYRALMEERAEGGGGDENDNDGVYRAAALEKEGSSNAADAEAESTSSGRVAAEEKSGEKEVQYGATLQGRSSCSLVVEADGTVTSSPTLGEHQSETTQDGGSTSASSLLIRDLNQCRVALKGTYQSIHIINANRTTVDVVLSSPVSGPVHVTACRGTTISVACRQLRIHDCTDVTFRVHVRSGPIIENCSGMVFRGDYYRGGDGLGQYGENMFRDVKDFNWLRSLVKSPNFVVVEDGEYDDEVQNPEKATKCGEVSAGVQPGSEALAQRNGGTGEAAREIGDDESSDDEDEL